MNKMMPLIFINPDYVTLNTTDEPIVEQMAQKMNGARNSMTFPRYDVIKKATCEITIEYPKELESPIDVMLRRLQTMGTLNKRRAKITIIK